MAGVLRTKDLPLKSHNAPSAAPLATPAPLDDARARSAGTEDDVEVFVLDSEQLDIAAEPQVAAPVITINFADGSASLEIP